MTLGKIKSKGRHPILNLLGKKTVSSYPTVKVRKRKKLLKKTKEIIVGLRGSTKFSKFFFYSFVWLLICTIGTGFMFLENRFENYLDKLSEQEFSEVAGVNSFEEAKLQGESNNVELQKPKNLRSTFLGMDKRAYVLEEYIKARNSPLLGHGKTFVEACDKYGAPRDCLSVIAIARHETDLCKYYYSAEMHNCMGWGGGGEYRMRFNSFEEHIFNAVDVLVNQYGVEYMNDPRKMEKVFCGPQDECIGWGDRVIRIMKEIDDFGFNLGVGRLSEMR